VWYVHNIERICHCFLFLDFIDRLYAQFEFRTMYFSCLANLGVYSVWTKKSLYSVRHTNLKLIYRFLFIFERAQISTIFAYASGVWSLGIWLPDYDHLPICDVYLLSTCDYPTCDFPTYALPTLTIVFFLFFRFVWLFQWFYNLYDRDRFVFAK